MRTPGRGYVDALDVPPEHPNPGRQKKLGEVKKTNGIFLCVCTRKRNNLPNSICIFDLRVQAVDDLQLDTCAANGTHNSFSVSRAGTTSPSPPLSATPLGTLTVQ